MADQKISQLTTITGANMADDDKFVLVDTSSDATVATTRAEFFKNTPDIDVVGTLQVQGDGVTLKLDGTSNTSRQINLQGTGTAEGQIQTDGNMHFIQEDAGRYMRFSTNNTERMRIDSSGNVLVGTTDSVPWDNSAGTTADNGIALRTGGILSAAKFGGVVALFNRTGTDGAIIQFLKDGTIVGNISVTASATAYNTSSDYRLKTDAQPMTGASERVQELNPVNFEWISDGTRVDGFLAHEAQEVVPESVTGERDAMRDEKYEVTPAIYEDITIEAVFDDEGNEVEAERTESLLVTEAVMGTRSVPDYQGIDQSKLVPLLTAALQEALTEISSLKSRVEALEG